jgi:signal transduction histidine kinase
MDGLVDRPGRAMTQAGNSGVDTGAGPERADQAADSLLASAPRFLVELIAWIAVPWTLAPYGIWLAVLADVLLIGLPTVFGMPGAKKQRNPVGIPARPAIALELLQPAAACVGAAIAWPTAVAMVVVAAALATCVLQRQRWRWMLARQTHAPSDR